MKHILGLFLMLFIISCDNRTQIRDTSIKDTLNQMIGTKFDSSFHKHQQSDNINELLKSIIIGNWQQTNDKKQVIVIKKDSIIDIYNGKIISSDPFFFSFDDSANKYYKGANVFNFERDSLPIELFQIRILMQNPSDTITNIILYVDSGNLELGYNHGIVSFKRIK